MTNENEKKRPGSAPDGEREIPAEEIKFETALARLEEIVRTLEGGRCPLEESMRYYEEGVRLVRICNEKLDVARRKIVTVTGGDLPEGDD